MCWKRVVLFGTAVDLVEQFGWVFTGFLPLGGPTETVSASVWNRSSSVPPGFGVYRVGFGVFFVCFFFLTIWNRVEVPSYLPCRTGWTVFLLDGGAFFFCGTSAREQVNVIHQSRSNGTDCSYCVLPRFVVLFLCFFFGFVLFGSRRRCREILALIHTT